MTQPERNYCPPAAMQSIYACVAVEDWRREFPGVDPLTAGRGVCDGCGRDVHFDPQSYELARQLAIKHYGKPNVYVQCRRCGDRWGKALLDKSDSE